MDKRIKGLSIALLFFISSLVLFGNLPKIVKADTLPDDTVVTTTLSATLTSEGSEIYKDSLLPLGFYPFFETPELDTGNFSHDLTRMDIGDVQKQFINSTLDYTNSYVCNLGSGVSGVQALETNQTIYEYTLSAPKDTEITIFMNYTIDLDFFAYTTVNKVANQDSNLQGIYYNNSKFYCIDLNTERVYVYDSTFTYTSAYYSISQTTHPSSLTADATYFYVLDENEDVYKYDSSWNYVSLAKDLTSRDSGMTDIRYFNGYFYALGNYYKQIYKYDASWNYVSSSGSLISDDLYSFWKVNDKWFVMSDSDNHKLYRFSSDFTYDEVSYDLAGDYWGALGGLAFDGAYFWRHGVSGAKFYQYYSHNFFDLETALAKSFNYSVLNTNYTEDIALNYDFNANLEDKYGNCSFTFDSSQLSYYNHVNDLTVNLQNITLELDKRINEADIDINIYVNYSYTQRQIVSEIDLKINGQDVLDTGYGAGFITFIEFQESLEFTSTDENIYFSFNLTSYFTFDINLDIISRTYLRKSFKLLSNHSISLTRITLSDSLDLLKIYLNNIDWGNETITNLSPNVEMTPYQIFWLEVITGNELYLPLSRNIYAPPIESEGGPTEYDLIIIEDDPAINDYEDYTFHSPAVSSIEIEENTYIDNISVQLYCDTGNAQLRIVLYPSEWDSGNGVYKPSVVASEYVNLGIYSFYASEGDFWYDFLDINYQVNFGTTDNIYFIGLYEVSGSDQYWEATNDGPTGDNDNEADCYKWNYDWASVKNYDFHLTIGIHTAGSEESEGSDAYYYQYKNQTTSTPRTDINSVKFEEYFQVNRSFKFWYFQDNYDINSVSLNHTNTDKIISLFEIDNSRYYFEELASENDTFIASIDYNPNWVVSYEIEINNGTYTQIKLNYKADLDISNVSIVLDLSSSGCYNENWTLNATQNSYNFKLIIPNIDFNSSIQTFYITGVSIIPYVSISSYESDQNYNSITVDTVIDFAGFLTFPKYTKAFLMTKSSDWDAFNVYYGDEIYSVQTISDTLISISGDGFDPAITTSFLHFTTKTFTEVDFDYNTEKTMITITINSTLKVDYCEFVWNFDVKQAHSLRIVQGDITDLSDKILDGYIFFRIAEIPEGVTVIKIFVDITSPAEMLVNAIFIFSVAGGFIAVYYYAKHHEGQMKKLKEYFNKKVIQKLERKKKQQELDKITISQKDGKLIIENQK